MYNCTSMLHEGTGIRWPVAVNLLTCGSMASCSGSSLHCRPLPCQRVLCGLTSSTHACLSAFLFVCATVLLWLQALEWLHKRGRAFCDLKPDNIRVQMGQQPGTFAHVTLVDLGGSVKFKGEQPSWACICQLGLHMAAFCFTLPQRGSFI